MKSFRVILASLRRALDAVHGMNARLDELALNQGKLFTAQNSVKTSTQLKEYEFKVFSQGGEDGIIQRLVSVIDIPEKTFIEFGVQDFSESNCRFLLMKDDWDGLVIDGSKENIHRLRNSYYFYKHNLTALDAFITRDNINELLRKSDFREDLGILSIDLDGNDYYILDAITDYRPRILICEYNAVFGPIRRISVPYDPAFVRSQKHHSHLYYGASLGALTYLASKKGYALVGTNSGGNNAFFVRSELLNSALEELDVAEAFTLSKFRESRDKAGNLTYASGQKRLDLIRGLPVVNVETNDMEEI